jgi:hypothetical protein
MGMKLFRQNMPVSVASALHVCIIPLVSVFWVKGKGQCYDGVYYAGRAMGRILGNDQKRVKKRQEVA